MHILIFFLCTILMTNAAVAQDPRPEPGKQVPQKMTVPKSTSVWKWEGGGENFAKLLATPKPLDESGTEDLQYLLFLPKDYNAEKVYDDSKQILPKAKEWPLLLFLHGAGERGDEVNRVAIHGPAKRLAKEPETAEICPFIVVSPQCHTDRYWSPAQLHLLLDEIEKQYKVDKQRIYVTGLSMGGFGTWMLTADRPERFAAVAPICGGSDISLAEKFVGTPLWVFHGEADMLVPVKLSRDMVKAVEEAGGKKVKLTTYPGVNHDSWTQTYENQELYEWFLSHSRND